MFRGPDENARPYVKRVVGLPGESIQIVNGNVHINGALVAKPDFVLRQTQVRCDLEARKDPDEKHWHVGTDYWTYNGSKVNRIETVYPFVNDPEKFSHRSVHYQSVGRHAITSAYRLGPDEYFVLGDNSPVSDDSRFWPTPGVKASALIGPVLFPWLESGE